MMLSNAITSLMDRIFNILLGLSTELNSMLGLSELFITATEPQVTKRVTKSPASRAICLQSNIATPFFRLVIEGTQDTISFYLIPTDSIISLKEVSLRYSALSTWKAHFGPQGQAIWESPAGILTEEMLNDPCLDLIRHLIEATQEAIEQTVQNHDVGGGLSEVDPLPPERTEHTARQTISSDGTRTDSFASLASLQTGIFETAGEDFETFETPSIKFEQEQLSEAVVDTHELAKLEPTWQPINREHSDFEKPDVPLQHEQHEPQDQQDQIVPKVAKHADFGKPNFPWQNQQQDPIIPKVAKDTEFGKPDFPWLRDRQDQNVPAVAKDADFGKPNFSWQREQQDMMVPKVAKDAEFGRPNFPWQQNQIVPEAAMERANLVEPNTRQQDEVVPEAAMERADLVEPRNTLHQDEIIPEAAMERADLVEPKSTWRQDEIIPEAAMERADLVEPKSTLQQDEIIPESAMERADLVEPKSTLQQEIIPETAIEFAEGKVEKESFHDLKKECHADVEEKNTSKKGVTSKRLTRKTNTRSNRKKRNKKNKK